MNKMKEDFDNGSDFLKKIVFTGQIDETTETKERVYNSILKKIDDNVPTKTIRYRFNRKYISVASIVIIILLSGLLYNIVDSKTEDTVYLVANSNTGNTNKVKLSDGSTVILNAGSTLYYPKEFNKRERLVKLEGEAFFDISKSKKKTFIVEAENIKIKVLGTKFNVKAYNTEDKITTTLVEGSVSFERFSEKGNAIIMKPNQQIVLDKISDSVILNEVDASLFSLWTDGIYSFSNMSFEDITKMLERGFNVDIQVESNSLKNEQFSGIFDNGESIEQILDLLLSYRPLTYKRENDKIIILDK